MKNKNEMKNAEIIKLLSSVIKNEPDKHLRRCAVLVLQEIDDSSTVQLFEKALQDVDESVRGAAIFSLEIIAKRKAGTVFEK